jgi:hypothetical protein
MDPGPERLSRARATWVTRALPLLLVALALLGLAFSVPSPSVGHPSVPGVSESVPSAQNDSSGGDPSGSAAALCPSSGPVILGVEWNCVAVLNLTELALILASIGIVAYVFKDADRAELPGDSEEVPVTAGEWEAYRRARKLGIRYQPPEPEDGDEGL